MDRRVVLISGVAGFLGSHLADAFLGDGCVVRGIDTLIGGETENVPAGVEFVCADCNDLARIRPLFAGVDVVYHCAATAYEGLSVFAPHRITQNIVTATTAMVSAAIAEHVRRFVLCSSMARYGENEVPFTEDMTPRPQDPYGIGKVSAELLLRNLAETHGMEWVIAVPHNIIGPRQRYDDPYRNVASIFINQMLQGQQPFVYGSGEQSRCFSFVSDVVGPLRQMATSSRCAGQVFNVGPDDELLTINELAQTVARLLDFPLHPRHVGARPCEVRVANCSADKARRLLGYEPRVKLADGLRQMIDHIRARGPRAFRYHMDLEIVTEKTPVTWSQRLY